MSPEALLLKAEGGGSEKKGVGETRIFQFPLFVAPPPLTERPVSQYLAEGDPVPSLPGDMRS